MNLADFHFIRPWWLLALLPAAVSWLALSRQKHARNLWTQVCDAELLPFIIQQHPGASTRWIGAIGGLVGLLSVLALAGPTWERLPVPAFRNDAGLVIALDLSASMDAADLKPSRLIKARYKIADLLKRRKDGQTALLVYAGDAFVVTPLTSDVMTIDSQLSSLNTQIMPVSGSNPQSALERAVALLKQAGLQHGHILLIADDTDSESLQAAKNLSPNYALSVLGIGTAEGAPVPLAQGGFLKDKHGAMVIPKLDASKLQALAASGRGVYRTITADDSDIKQLLAFIGLESSTPRPSHQQTTELQQWDEKGVWLLLLIVPLAALGFRKGLLAVLPALLLMPQDSLAFDWQNLWRNADQQAVQAFQQQHYEQAATQFQSPEWKAAAQYKAGQYQQAAQTLQNLDTADAHYNRGNALAQAGQLQPAIEAYQQALKQAPNHQDAKFNKELVEKALQKQQQQQQPNPSNQQPKDQEQQSNPSTEQQSDSKQPEQQASQGDKPEKPAESKQASDESPPAQNPQSSESATEKTEKPHPAKQEQAAQAKEQADESKQADAQWLKRIPDEPAGLLKRKFKYQYNQRDTPARDDSAW